MDQLQPSIEGNSYKSVSKQLQYLMNNDTYVNKQIQETTKEPKMISNTNTYAYI